MAVTVYSKPACSQCVATYRELDKKGIAYESVDMAEKPEALEYVRSLGYQQAPVIVVDEDNHWSGFRKDRIAELAD